MLLSSEKFPPGAVVDTQVCIVGAGPAGLTLAREFAGASFKVLLVESGDFRSRRKLKELNEGDTVGDPYPNPRWQRVRQVGGCANRWLVEIGNGRKGARFVRLDGIDFERREWIPHSGWPITRAELDPFYERAATHCGIHPDRYGVEAWPLPGSVPIETEGLATSMFQFGPQERWISHHDDLFRAEPNIDVLLGATVTTIETDEWGQVVTGLQLVTRARQSLTVRAEQVILATGCIETSRLLLASNAVNPSGIGNANGVVGRYFMDHPQSYLNTFKPSDHRLFETTGIFDLRPNGDMAVMAKLGFTEGALRRHRLPNSCHILFPRRDHFLSEAFQSFFSLVLAAKYRALPGDIARHALNMARGLGDLLPIAVWALQGKAHYPYLSKGGWAGLEGKSDLFSLFEIWSMVEQLPDPDNRILLSDKRDHNGMRKVEIHWRFSSQDRDGVQRMREQMRREIEGSGLGTVEWSRDLYSTPSSVHPIGGARMGDDPASSVVDADLRVHAMANLFVASSAVFPTSGYANPTLTVVALCCRLADRIKALRAMPADMSASNAASDESSAAVDAVRGAA